MDGEIKNTEAKSELEVYSELALKHNAALAAFKTMHEAKHPLPQLMKADRSDWYIALGLIVIVLASVIVSGSRTIAEFGGGLIGISAFVMLECAVVAYTFLRTKNNLSDERIQHVNKLLNRGVKLAFVVAVAANIHAVLHDRGLITSNVVNLVIVLMMGISAPTLAFISGDIAGLEYMRAVQRHRKIDDQNQILMQEWQDELNRSWAAAQRNWGVKVSIESFQPRSNGIPLENPMEYETKTLPSRSTLGHSKQPQAAKIVRDYLQENPQAIEMNPLELAALLNVGKSTVYSVIKSVKGETGK